MQRYYCKPIKLYVCFVCRFVNNYFEVLLFGHTNGVLLYPITLPLPTGRKRCAYIDTKQHPWLYDWLIENNIANPTNRCLVRDNFCFKEFSFRKDI